MELAKTKQLEKSAYKVKDILPQLSLLINQIVSRIKNNGKWCSVY